MFSAEIFILHALKHHSYVVSLLVLASQHALWLKKKKKIQMKHECQVKQLERAPVA